MFAILISNETMPKINEVEVLSDSFKTVLGSLYCNKRIDWYLITGFVTERGGIMPWNILPAFVFIPKFEHDEEKIKTDWDIIVRK